MHEFARRLVREPAVATVEQYRQRVYWLAQVYAGLFGASLLGLALLVWQGQLYVSLTQRSNVETLTLLFLMVFFSYVAALSRPGAAGAARIASSGYWPGWRRTGRQSNGAGSMRSDRMDARARLPP